MVYQVQVTALQKYTFLGVLIYHHIPPTVYTLANVIKRG